MPASSSGWYALALPFDELDDDWKPTFGRHYPGPVCEGCSLRDQCPGTYTIYEELHGTAGLRRI